VLEDLHALRDRARAALGRGDYDSAHAILLSVASQTHVAEHDYLPIVRALEQVFTERGEARAALTLIAYLAPGHRGALDRAKALATRVPASDRARLLALEGRTEDAAREMENAGLVAAAAVLREKAKDWAGARALWSRLAHVTERGDDAYVAALVRFNLARCAKQCGDSARAREALVASVRLLEEAADHFETIDQRERAFDCFQVLTQVGRESGAIEDVLEGFVNCIRILREDHLKYFALEYFEEAIVAAAERGETSAAATLAKEAAAYGRSQGFPSAATGYVLRQAELWRAAAKQHLDRGSPPEIAENALLAAILSFGEVGQYARVGNLYRELGRLELEASRREHYARAAARYENVADMPLETSGALSHAMHSDTHFAEVWHVDVVEW